ncbi:MAG: hypothetical protein MZV64_15815 [Ignavibacteriales bacterium]|nr:hypothetical protein [Ignavibacteriales bacterium]
MSKSMHSPSRRSTASFSVAAGGFVGVAASTSVWSIGTALAADYSDDNENESQNSLERQKSASGWIRQQATLTPRMSGSISVSPPVCIPATRLLTTKATMTTMRSEASPTAGSTTRRGGSGLGRQQGRVGRVYGTRAQALDTASTAGRVIWAMVTAGRSIALLLI